MNRFIIAEPKLCIGCNTCMAACSDVHTREGLQSHPRLKVIHNINETAPVMCRHCEDAPCAKVCPVQAITHQNDSIHLNESTCIGCKLCAIACPFGAIDPGGSQPIAIPKSFPQNTPVEQLTDFPETLAPVDRMLEWLPGIRVVAVKCDLCHFSPDGPECIRTCPTHALFMVDNQTIEKVAEAKRQDAMSWFADDLPYFNDSTLITPDDKETL